MGQKPPPKANTRNAPNTSNKSIPWKDVGMAKLLEGLGGGPKRVSFTPGVTATADQMPLAKNLKAQSKRALNKLSRNHALTNKNWSNQLKKASDKTQVVIESLARLVLGPMTKKQLEKWAAGKPNARWIAAMKNIPASKRNKLRDQVAAKLMSALAGVINKNRFSYTNMHLNDESGQLQYSIRTKQIEAAVQSALKAMELGNFKIPQPNSSVQRGSLLQELDDKFKAIDARYRLEYSQAIQQLDSAAEAVMASKFPLNSTNAQQILAKLRHNIKLFEMNYTPGKSFGMYERQLRGDISALVSKSPHANTVQEHVKYMREFRYTLQDLDNLYTQFNDKLQKYEAFKARVLKDKNKNKYAKILPTVAELEEEMGPFFKPGQTEKTAPLEDLNSLAKNIVSTLRSFGPLKRFFV